MEDGFDKRERTGKRKQRTIAWWNEQIVYRLYQNAPTERYGGSRYFLTLRNNRLGNNFARRYERETRSTQG
jgi:hypothetical protein